MTKVQKHFRLERPLDEALMQQIADVHSIYGIEWIRIAPSREELAVEFDASRLRSSDVEAALQRAGIPVPSGGTAQSQQANAPSDDAAYCAALSKTYRQTAPQHQDPSATVPTAVANCAAGNTAAGIPVLEQALRNGGMTVPTRTQ